MQRHKVAPQILVRPADVIRKSQPQPVSKTEASDHFQKRPLMTRFAVHQHPIHIKDDRLPLRPIALVHWSASFSPAKRRIRRNWSLVSGCTESRLLRISGMFANSGSD